MKSAEEYIVTIAGSVVVFLAGLITWGAKKWMGNFEGMVARIMGKLDDIDRRLDGIETQLAVHATHMQEIETRVNQRFASIEERLNKKAEQIGRNIEKINQIERHIDKFKTFHQRNHPEDKF